MASDRARRLTSAVVVLVVLHQSAAATAWIGRGLGSEQPASPKLLSQNDDCAAPAISGRTEPLDAAAGGADAPPGAIRLTLTVPPTTRLRVEGGRVVAATTNTGCAPRSSDLVTVVPGNRLATAAERAQLVNFQHGDWRQAGRWHEAQG